MPLTRRDAVAGCASQSASVCTRRRCADKRTQACPECGTRERHAFPGVFDDADWSVVAISAERTFWEKATILHQHAHRSSVMPPRYSRHYYDMYKLANSAVKDAALANVALLQDVVAFKQRFYPSRWARYEDAKTGTFKLTPSTERVGELRRDYRDMAIMGFGDVPAFDEIMDALRHLEDEINASRGD